MTEELDMNDEIEELMDTLMEAWSLLANAGRDMRPFGENGWARESEEWEEAAIRWRDERFHPALSRYNYQGEPEDD